MNKIEYLEKYHEISQSLIGLVSIQETKEGVDQVLIKWKPMLDDIFLEYAHSVCKETGVDPEEFVRFLK